MNLLLGFRIDVKNDIQKLREDIGEDLNAIREDVTDLRKDVSDLRSDVNDLRKDFNVMRKDVNDLRKDVDIMRKDVDIMRKDVDELRVEVRRADSNASEAHRTISEIMEFMAATSFEKLIKTKFPLCDFTSVVYRNKTFPSASSLLTPQFRELVALLPMGTANRTEWSQQDGRISLVSSGVEIDLMLKIRSFSDNGQTPDLFTSPRDSAMPLPMSPYGVSPTSPLLIRSRTAAFFTGCIVGEVTRATLVPAFEKDYHLNNQSFQKLVFKMLQMERAITAINAYYQFAGSSCQTTPVIFALLMSPSFSKAGTSWKGRKLLGDVFALVPGALPNLHRLHEQHSLLLHTI